MTPTDFEHGHLEGNIAFLLKRYCKEHHLPATETPSGYGNAPPELVVEVVSPNDRADVIEANVQEWLDFGVLLVWVVYPRTRRVHVHRQGGDVTILGADETLSGGEALPGFGVTVGEFFAD